jgi:acyl dehydratase
MRKASGLRSGADGTRRANAAVRLLVISGNDNGDSCKRQSFVAAILALYDFDIPFEKPSMLYFEDIPLHETRASTATHLVSADEIKNFASEWDPMPFHVDEAVARQTPMGKLFASGVHSIAISIRLGHTMMDREIAVLAGLGWQDVRFPTPLFAGDTVRLQTEIVETRLSQSKPDRGIITSRNTLLNQDDAVVVEYKLSSMVLRQPA